MIYIPKVAFDIEANNSYLETLSKDYEVKINGMQCDVNVCRVSAMPFNCVWPGHQRNVNQSELASFINFYGDEEVTLEIKCNREFKNCIVRPLSKGIDTKRNGDTVTFILPKNGNYVFEMDDTHIALHIFYNAPLENVNPEEVTYYFGPGVHRQLLLTLKSNESVYIHPEAVVYGAVYCENSENVRIFGGGILNSSCIERVSKDCYDKFSLGNIRMFDTKDISIEDVILMDSANWVCGLFGCENVLISNVKIVGQWRYNNDGIDLVNSSNVKIQNCFIRSFDDTICVKALYNHKCCENIEVENCVCWCEWGKTLELGLETSAEEYRNISYKNCDLIHNDAGAIAISNGNYADIHDIHYENINVEFQAYKRAGAYQGTDEMTFPDNGLAAIGETIRIENPKFCDEHLYSTAKERIADERNTKYGKTYNITYKNIRVYKDEGMDDIKLRLCSYSADIPLENIEIDGVTVNGVKIDNLDELDIIKDNVKDVFYNGEKYF